MGDRLIFVPAKVIYQGTIHASIPTLPGLDVATTGVISYPEVFPFSLFEPKGNEQALVDHVAGQGLVLITDCGHPVLEKLVEWAESLYGHKVIGVVGGLHFGAKTHAECVVWLQKVVAQGASKPADEETGSGMSLKDYLTEWLETVQSTLKPKTSIQYRQIIQQHIIPNIGNLRLRDLHIERIERFYAELLKKGVGVRTIRITHSVLHVAMEKAVRYGLVPNNPAHGAAVPKQVVTEMSTLDEEQVPRFLTAAHGSRHYRLFHLAIVTGIREAELLGLKWADLSWNKGLLYVRRQAQRVPGQGMVFSEPKTRAGRRTVKLGETTLQILREQMQFVHELRLLAGYRGKDNDLIFPSTIGTPIDQSGMTQEYFNVLEKAGLPKIRFHDLRHTAASLMLNHNVPVIVVSKMLGHSKPSVTLDIYGHLCADMQDGAVQVMDDLVTPIRVELPGKNGGEMLRKCLVINLHQITAEK